LHWILLKFLKIRTANIEYQALNTNSRKYFENALFLGHLQLIINLYFVRNLLLLIIFLSFFGSNLSAQQTILALQRNDTLKVTIGTDSLDFPWTGGFNFCQVGNIDLNLDGQKDVVVFDRTGNRLIPLVFTGSPESPRYKHEFRYTAAFPLISNFIQLVDFNCDGKEDIVTFANSGLKLYKNISTSSDGLKFELYQESLQSLYNNVDILPVFTIPIDIPNATDVDNDGDLDFLVFSLLGSCVEYHRNMAQENLGRCDTVVLKLETDNWGKFTESFSSNTVTFNDSCDRSTSGKFRERHVGSTILAFDSDGDNDKDLLIGDIAYATLTKLINGGNANEALITEQQTNFPANTTFINLAIFPGAFYVDINQDGKRDLVVSPNSKSGSENFTCIWYYKNEGTDILPIFSFEKNQLFVDETLDFGEGAVPVFFDYNNDGKKDLVVGNYGYFQTNGNYAPKLALLKNNGTNENPTFDLVTRDYANLGALAGNSTSYHPTFGDLDGDGDLDLLVGTSDGRIFRLDNTASSGQIANFVFVDANFQGIDIGTFATPFLGDVDLDGKIDLLVGKKDGTVSYFRNTSSNQQIQLTEISSTFGNINTALPGEPNGYSTPVLFRKSGTTYIISGSTHGPFYIYSGIDGNLNGDFILEDSLFLGTSIGERSSITLSQMTDDAFPEAVTGNYSGGINYFNGVLATSFPSISNSSSDFVVFPNPSIGQFIIKGTSDKIKEIIVTDVCGKIVLSQTINDYETTCNLENEANGIYWIAIITNNSVHRLPWIKYF
jgi:hypothetical protein